MILGIEITMKMHNLILLDLLVVGVGFQVEVHEQSQKSDHVKNENPDKENGICAVGVDVVDTLNHVQGELDHLHLSNVLLEPDLNLESGEQVVEVHDNVNSGVQKGTEVSFTTRTVEDDSPPDQQNARVMVNMQKANLTEILLQDHQESVTKLENLGKIKQPKNLGHSKLTFTNRISPKAEVIDVGLTNDFNGHVGTPDGEDKIVQNSNPFESKRSLNILHDSRTNKDN